MRTWDLALPVAREGGEPLFLQISRAVAEAIRAGRLRPGEPVPGTRTLAHTLGVHRNTVLAAVRELVAEGWLVTSPARGTFVSQALPERRPRPFAEPPPARSARRVGFALKPAPSPWGETQFPPGAAVLVGGRPDLTMVPAASLGRAYRRALKRHGANLLGYGNARGHERLRAAVAGMLATTRGLDVTAAQVVITRGSQMASFLAARALLSPGDVVAVEALGYPPAWEAMRASGARLVPVPVDVDGMNVAALAALMRTEPVRAVYLTPHHQFPTTVSLSPGRRLELLTLAQAKRVLVIEDDYDHEFHYEGRPILPLASADRAGVVVYLGTLSKVLAPAVRTGYIVAPEPVIDRLAAHRAFVDISGDPVVEAALAELFEDGEVQRHVRRARRVYQSRRDALVQALRDELGAHAHFEVPTGGMALWCRLEGIDVEPWVAACAAAGVRFQAGRMFAFDGRPRPCVRLGFAAVNETQIRAAVRTMAALAKEHRTARRTRAARAAATA
ncbi:MAG TPA: PLP-dependent aminotransferase family protein [Candidatus Eisenbacteria bacterium]|nr:PLP-dependent aminotransferase family protein [Candidatus Eisenbacteria bacterium]